jgi:glyoxylase-like metal-dependent hydrolase (beta-lactamase superfamily II)
MIRLLWLFGSLSCGPLIRLPATPVQLAEGRRVELCVAFQERASRPLATGVAQATFERWDYALASIVVKHPSGLVVIDPAIGQQIGDDLSEAGPFSRLLFGEAASKRPLVDVLAAAGIASADVRLALVTHAHWDHTGALSDLPNAQVWLSARELSWARRLHRRGQSGVMPSHLKAVKSRLSGFSMNGPPAEGFASSFDIFGDGSIIAVPLPGHTPGSVGYLVQGNHRRFLFVGDTAWTTRGIRAPVHKSPFARLDSDEEAVADSLGRLHVLAASRPDISVIAAHDGTALSQIDSCARGE